MIGVRVLIISTSWELIALAELAVDVGTVGFQLLP
jgi:hypothetical protein